MHDIEKPFWWYELRDWLRQEFIRCMRERRAFPKERLQLLNHAEDIVARWEGLQREYSASERATSMRRGRLTPDGPAS